MENNGKSKKLKVTAFKKNNRSRHFTGTMPPVNDVLGSYTGTPVTFGEPEDDDDFIPVQDADDL
ncbi:MAG: hypothetical protein IKL10_11225 [Clostridia bacterium]|nr:hypothetical protein [Clostridia bacterium]